MTNENTTYKIALIGDCLANGGAEKVHALLSVYLEKQGIEVHNCIFVDWINYDYSGSILNLGKVNPDSNLVKRKISRFFELRKFLKEHNFDIVIDFRMRTGLMQELAISKFCYPSNTFYTVHSGVLDFYFPKSSIWSKFIYSNKKIVAVSKAIQALIISKGLANNVFQIYNPIDTKSIAYLKEEFEVSFGEYILATGRMNDDIKQFDKLIVAYSQSVLPLKKIKLILLGNGQNQSKYRTLVAQLGLNDLVVFTGFVDNPFPYYRKALFAILSSKNEGFPNVILESFAVGTPVVSFDCFSGPSEIIIDQQNSLLVTNQDFNKLTEAMNLFTLNEQLREQCKLNVKESLEDFDIEKIGGQWLKLIKIK